LGGKARSSTDTVDFSKVKEIRFAISNNPDKKDVIGEGFVIISKVVGQAEPGIWEKYKDLIIAIISAFAGIIAGYFIGRKKSE
jgi:hypothetical protein